MLVIKLVLDKKKPAYSWFFNKMVEGGGFEPPKAEPSDLQSDPFGHSGTPPQGQQNNKLICLKMKPSNVLLSHGNSHTTIGATAFHF